MTKNQKLRAEIAAGSTKYVHVSVQVATSAYGEPMRTMKGKGGTATRLAPKLKGRAMRLLREAWAREAKS